MPVYYCLFISTLILDIYFQNIYLHKLINVHHSDLMLMHKHLCLVVCSGKVMDTFSTC